MKFWQSIAWMETEQLLEVAKFAEEVGFHGVINGDHAFFPREVNSPYLYTEDGKMPEGMDDHPFPDVWSSMAAMAAVTTRLHFTSSVYLLPLRSPFDVAKAAGTIAVLSDNRVAIGMGVGWLKEEFDVLGIDFHTRGKRANEMIEVMHKLWSGEWVSHQGEFFDFPDLRILPAPTRPVPIYCGGTSGAALRRAATMCDGYIGPGHPVEEVPALLAEFARLRQEAGRDHQPFETILPLLAPPEADTFKRLEDQGMTATFTPPFLWSVGTARSTIDEKKRAMEDFARNVIEKVN